MVHLLLKLITRNERSELCCQHLEKVCHGTCSYCCQRNLLLTFWSFALALWLGTVMASIVKGVVTAVREKGLRNFLMELKEDGFLRCLPDGNLLQVKIHNIGAKLVGVDQFGNKYYEKLEGVIYGRHRWVEYAKKDCYNASQVPPESHGWLHNITDRTGDELLMLRPKRYALEHKENFSGEGE